MRLAALALPNLSGFVRTLRDDAARDRPARPLVARLAAVLLGGEIVAALTRAQVGRPLARAAAAAAAPVRL